MLKVLAKNDTWQIPTLALNTGFVKKHYAYPDWTTDFQYLPSSIADQWESQIAEVMKQEMTPFRAQQSQWMFDMVGKIHRTGIPIMAGTDCPIFFLTPGRSLHQELAVLVEAGLSPQEAIKAATTNPAKYFNLEQVC